MYMHGRVKKEGEDRLLPQKITSRTTGFGQHMQSVPSPTPTRISVEGKSNSLIVSTGTATDTASSFSKDGRKISVGDCALFKPPHDSPPFIGVICSLGFSDDKNLQLGVTWLYRPTEVTLGKGFFLDAAPNEVFYSFHKDDKISAASLLHPCKVAFLPKGVELPKGMSSFVCRRVYDIDSKCLWWLTDKDYLHERQEEVNKLLKRTQKEMEQAGGCSPTVTCAASHLKSVSDNLQNSVTSASSQIKGKKRDRSEQSYDHVKREHPIKADNGDSGTPRSGNRLRLEIAKIKEKGGLVDSVLVEKLVELIRPRADRKLDLGIRSMVSGIIAATDRCDCLSQFVQLKGLSVLDEWLQDVNKGRLKDSCGSMDDDKSVEEFLFVLLRALDKLPVNLHALQTCNIGRSVNHLRSHKNLEIQKKARSLVDIWKKRVEVEMNVKDSKPSKSRLPEVHGGKTSGGSCEVSLKSSVSQPSEFKAASIKASSPKEATTRPACSSPGTIKSASLTATEKEIKNRNVPSNGSDVPLTCREDKNCTSALPHVSVKEDSRFPVAGTVNIRKSPSVGSRHRKSINGITETLETGTVSGKSSLVHENASHAEMSPQSVVMCEKTFTKSVVDSGSHKLLVKIPNPNRTAVQCPIGVLGDSSIMNGLTSPVSDQANVASHVNIELLNGNDREDLQAGGDRCLAALHCDLISKSADESSKSSEGSRSPSSSLEKDLKVKKPREASSTAMDALIESCAKYSEESASTSPGDDLGINLLASVAAREVCASEIGPRNAPAEEENSLGDGSMSDNIIRDVCTIDAENGKTVIAASTEHSGDRMACSDLSKGIKVIADCSSVIDEKSSNAFSCISEDKKLLDEKTNCLTAEVPSFSDTEADGNGSSFAEVTISKGVAGEDYRKKVEKSSSSALHEIVSKKGVEKNLIPDGGEIMQPTVSCKDVSVEIDDGDADKSCIDHKLVKESAFRTLDVSGDEKLKTSNLSDDKLEKKDSGEVEMDSKLDFDLNQAFLCDDVKYDEQPNSSISGLASYPGSIPDDLLRNKGDIEWKGSATTSAFHSAEPLKVSTFNGSTSKHCQRLFDIDLNVADDNLLEDVTSQHSVDHLKFQLNSKNECNGTDLDLNRVDDSNFMMQYPARSSHRLDLARSVPFSANDVKRDFDLNNGPGFDNGVSEQFGGTTLSMHTHLPFSGLRSNGLEIENLSNSFPLPNPYSLSAIPDGAITPLVAAPSQRILSNPFMSDMYRGAVLPTSPYQMFPFGPISPLPSNTFLVGSSSSLVNSHFINPNNGVSPQYPNPFVTGQPLTTGLDLNADVVSKDDFKPQRQVLVSGSNMCVEEQQGRMYSIIGGAIKRKEPEGGGLDRENLRYKQPSWH